MHLTTNDWTTADRMKAMEDHALFINLTDDKNFQPEVALEHVCLRKSQSCCEPASVCICLRCETDGWCSCSVDHVIRSR